MKRLILLSSALVFSHSSLADSGQQLFDKLCSSCHATAGKPTVAPPIFGVKSHVKSVHSEREAFVQYVADWVKQPDATQSLMPGAIRRFGLMPTLDYAEADVRKVAEYLYDTQFELPPWFKKHYRQQHGQAPAQ